VQTTPDTILDRIRYWAGRPEQLAFSVDGDTCSYAELWNNAEKLAAALRGEGVRPGDRVAALLPDPFAYASSMVATWLAGGIYVPLNPDSPSGELTFIEDCCAPAITLTTDCLAQISSPSSRPETSSTDVRSASDVALLLFTSGTTGQPKGVGLSFANLHANTRSIVEYLDIQPSDVCLNVMPFHYSYGNSVLLGHLWSGARIHQPVSAAFPVEITQALAAEEVTSLPGVPTFFRAMLRRGGLGRQPLPDLRYLTVAGGALSATELDALQTALPDTDVIVMYGQTEATARISYLRPELLASRPGSVGVPLPDVEVTIRDEGGRLLPPGEIGEVCVRGPNVMAGYWQAEGLLAPPDGLLQTGDLGYLDADGFLYLNGRKNEMIKSGGYRLFAREIEEVLNTHDAVIESAVIKAEDALLGEVPLAYVVLRNDDQASTLALMRHCKQHLDPHKLPKKIFPIDALPKTSSGKVRKTELGP
jgi:acyl-CoA synthetase (AMP-forming)/AMP-acid ligase II